MIGMDARTGCAIRDEAEHIHRAIRDILTTPVGSRIERREYGSLVPDLIDHPANGANFLRLSAATVMAVIKGEPRVAIQGVRYGIDPAGRVTCDIDGVRRNGPRAGDAINLAIPIK